MFAGVMYEYIRISLKDSYADLGINYLYFHFNEIVNRDMVSITTRLRFHCCRDL